MFFPKLRRQAKWMFVFLALVFGLGFVVFGVGSGGGLGLGDILQRGASSSSGPSVGDAKDKIEKGDLNAYKELSEAYLADGELDKAIAAGERYVKANPKDYEFMRSLASDYEGKANGLREQAAGVQEKLTSQTGGTTFGLPANSKLGRALGTGRIDQELTTAANTELTRQYSGIQSAYTRATQLYQKVAAANPDEVLLQMLLAQSAYQAQLNPTAVKAYRRVCKLAPESAECGQARQQIRVLKLQQQQAANAPSG
jgi:tetratricopeptide (TPR) repeat protein